MNNQHPHNETLTTKKKSNKGCLITVLVAFCFLCLCIVLPLTMGIPKTEEKNELSDNAKQIKEICNTTEEQALAINEILEKCEIVKIDKIEHDDMLDDMFNTGDTGYRIQSQGIKNIILYLDSNKQVITLRYASIDMYSDGVYKTKFGSFYLTTSEETRLQISTQNSVKSILKSPSTADFPNITEWDFHLDYTANTVSVSSYVDSQNSFGATIRSEFAILYQIIGDIEEGEYTLLCFVFDNKMIVDNR